MEEKQNIVSENVSPSVPSGDMPPLPEIGAAPLPVQNIVNRLEDLVRFALECEHKPLASSVSFVDVYKQLLEIRKSIDILSKDQQTMLATYESAGLTRDQLNEALSIEDKKVVAKLSNLQGICEAAKDRLHKSLEKSPEATREVKEKMQEATSTEKQKVVHRKGKFKSLGGKEGWMPT